MRLTNNNIADLYVLQQMAKVMTIADFTDWLKTNGVSWTAGDHIDFNYKSIGGSINRVMGYLCSVFDCYDHDDYIGSINSESIVFNE